MNGPAGARVERTRVRCALVMILVAAGVVRSWGIAYDLPYVYHPDEPVYVEISQRIFKTGDLNPHFFNYPSLLFYIHALAYLPYYWIGRCFGPFESPEDILPPVVLTMGVVKSPMPTTVLMGRIITLVFGIGSVVLTFVATRALTTKNWAGLLAAALMAASPTNVWNNRWMTPDTLVTFFALASLSASVLVFREGRTWQYAAAGMCVGLTAASKYNGALVVSTLLAAHFLRSGVEGFWSPNLYAGLLLSGLAFVATTPFAVLDFPAFVEDLQFEAEHYLTGHAGMEGDTVRWYARHLWANAGPVCLFAVAELVRGAFRRPRETTVTAVFPVVYFAFINRFTVRNARTIMPLTPYLFLLGACFLVRLCGCVKDLERKGARRAGLTVVVGLTAVSLALPAVKTISTNRRLWRPDSREMARQWIASQLPRRAKIAVESYGPFVDPELFSVQGVVRIIDHDPAWYVENGFEYVIFSKGMYGRYYADRDKHAAEVSRYDAFFNQLGLVREFETDYGAIRIYRVGGG